MSAHRPWTPADDDYLRTQYPTTITLAIAAALGRSLSATYARAQKLGLRKPDDYYQVHGGGRLQKGRSPNATSFRAGHSTWNKGTHFAAGGRSVETRFKTGNRPQTVVPIGTVAQSTDGYWKRKVREDAPPGLSRRNWIWLHLELWEQHHGPVPPNHCVVFRNGNTSDIRIENLELVHRHELILRNSIHNLPGPLKEAIRAKGRLQRKINEKVKADEEQDRRPA